LIRGSEKMIEVVGSLVVLVVGSLVAAYFESRDYKDGLCCGVKLRHFDNDSQGGRGYACDRCFRHIWISYPWVDKRPAQR
jgi:hypothetical protein